MEFKFDEIAFNSKAKKLPEESDRQYYIGLEHLDTNSLYVSRWGSDVTPVGEKLLMKKGDVLFGKRRAYQRKVGIAPFDGIFSAHGMVLRPKEGVIDKDYFPFFISSDQFMERAVRISVGGLSPTINWKDLKEQVFDIPTLEEQKKLASKLWAAYKLREEYKRLLTATDEMVKSRFIEMIKCAKHSVKLGDLFDLIRNGANIKQGVRSDGYPITRIETIADGFVNRNKMGYAGIMDDSFSGYYLHDNDILMSHINSMKHIGKSALYKKIPGETVIHGMNLLCLRLKDGIANPVFILYLLQSDSIREEIRLISKQAVNQASFTVSDLKNISCSIPDIGIQEQFERIAQQADKSKFELKQAIEKIDNVMRALMQ